MLMMNVETFSDGAKRLTSKAFLASRASGFSLSSLRNSSRNAPRLYVTNAIANNGGYTGITENETAPRTYTWPDNKVYNSLVLCMRSLSFHGGFRNLMNVRFLFTEAEGVHFRWRVWRIVHGFEIRIACVARRQEASGDLY